MKIGFKEGTRIYSTPVTAIPVITTLPFFGKFSSRRFLNGKQIFGTMRTQIEAYLTQGYIIPQHNREENYKRDFIVLIKREKEGNYHRLEVRFNSQRDRILKIS